MTGGYGNSPKERTDRPSVPKATGLRCRQKGKQSMRKAIGRRRNSSSKYAISSFFSLGQVPQTKLSAFKQRKQKFQPFEIHLHFFQQNLKTYFMGHYASLVQIAVHYSAQWKNIHFFFCSTQHRTCFSFYLLSCILSYQFPSSTCFFFFLAIFFSPPGSINRQRRERGRD